MDGGREYLECPSTTEEQETGSSRSSPLQRVIAILLHYASAFEDLFTVPVPDELALAAWKSVPNEKDMVQGQLREMDLHILASGLLLHLKELNGSILTDELHDRFVAAAGISSRYSQIYVFRLLLGNLPPANHAILKNLALLLRCTTFKTNPNVSKQVIITFGRLLMKRRDDKAIVHRQLTAVEAGTLFTVVLIEEWNYLFQYGRVSFHDSLAKADLAPISPWETGLLKSSNATYSNAANALVPSEKVRSTAGGVTLHGCPQQQHYDDHTTSGNSGLRLASPRVEANTSTISCEPGSKRHGAGSFSGSLQSQLQNNIVGKELAPGDFPQNDSSFGLDLKRKLAGLTGVSNASKFCSSSSQLLPGSEGSCEDDSAALQTKSRESTENHQEKNFKEQDVSCDVPSYWKHWFEEQDVKFCHDILKYALAKTRGKQESVPCKVGFRSRTSKVTLHEKEVQFEQSEGKTKFSWDEYGPLPEGIEDDDDATGNARGSETMEGSQIEENLFTLGGSQRSDLNPGANQVMLQCGNHPSGKAGVFGRRSLGMEKCSASRLCYQTEEVSLSHCDIPAIHLRPGPNSVGQDEDQPLGRAGSADTSTSGSMKSTNSRLSSQQGEVFYGHSDSPLANASQGCNPLVWQGGIPLGVVDQDRNAVDTDQTTEGRSSSNREEALVNHLGFPPPYPGSGRWGKDDVSTVASAYTSQIPKVTHQTGENFLPQDGSPIRESSPGTRQGFYHGGPINMAPEIACGDGSSRNMIPLLSMFPEAVLGKRSANDTAGMNKPVWQEGKPTSLSISCLDRVQNYIQNVLIYKQSKGSIVQEPSWSNELATGSSKMQLGDVCRGSDRVEDNSGSQLIITSSELESSQASSMDQGIQNWSSEVLSDLDAEEKFLETLQKMSDTSLSNVYENGPRALSEGPCSNAALPHQAQEVVTAGSHRVSPSLSPKTISALCHAISQHAPLQFTTSPGTNEEVKSSLPQRLCNRICTSLTQSNKIIEGVLGACADVVVTSLLPVLEPTDVLGQEVTVNPEGLCQSAEIPSTPNLPSVPTTCPPCTPPGSAPGRPVPPPPPPRPPPPPPPPPPPRRTTPPTPHPTLTPNTPHPAPKLPPPPPPSRPVQTTPSSPTPPPPTPPPQGPLPPLRPSVPCPPPPPFKKLAPPPPPPPVVGKSTSNVQAKKPKMKQLVWDKITGPTADLTVWKTATPSAVKMDLEELEALFALKDTPSTDKPNTKAVSVGMKTQGVQVLDLKRAHNIGIQLRSLRKPVPELCQALRDKDEAVLTMEVLNVLLNTLPSDEDIALLKAYQGNPTELAEVEMYYVELLRIPRYEKLIKAFMFKGQYGLSFQQIEQELKLLEQACDQLKASQSFKKILEMVLAVGNHLNGDSFRGAARGFKLGALLKLMDVKSHNKKTTLLHFVVAELMRTDENVVKLTEESRAVKAAANLSLERLQSGVRELEHGLEFIKVEVALLQETSHEDQQLLDLMMPFYKKADTEISGLRGLYNTTVANLKDLAVYFGETLKEDRLIDLFRTMREFLFMFDQVTAELRASRRREVENASKRSQTNSSYSCPASPAHKGFRAGKQNMADSKRNVDHPRAKQPDSAVTSSSRQNNTDSSGFPQPSRPSTLSVFEKGQVASSYSSVENHKQYFPTSCQKSSSVVRTSSSWAERSPERPEPFSSQSTCYDSDWSTG